MPQDKIYKFEEFKVQIKNPVLKIVGVNDHYIGEASIDIELSIGSVNNKLAVFGVRLDGFTYTTDWTQSEVAAWVDNELQKFEV